MNQTFPQNGRRNRDQVLREIETLPEGNRSKRRRIPWTMETPRFVPPMFTVPYDLTLHAGRNNRVFVCGDPMTGSQVIAASETTARTVYARGQHFPSVTCGDGTRVTYAGAWFGKGPYEPRDAAMAWEWLETKCQQAWSDTGIRLLMTPATTGRDLWSRSIDRAGWPVISPEVQSIIRASGGQGRMETFPKPWVPFGRDLYEYDARMAYVALMDELPIGDPEYLHGGEAARWSEMNPYLEGRFDVEWIAPPGWKHPGILAAHADSFGSTDWIWPLDGRGWASGAEIFAARRAGWSLRIHAGWVWRMKGSPMKVWRTRLLRILAESETLDGALRPMLRSAIRALILHTVGSFYGAPHWTTHTGDDPPPEARRIRALQDGRLTWEQPQAALWPEMVHPEWAVTIWGRSRARLVSGHQGRTGMLSIDPATIVAFRTDAIYTTVPTGWETFDNGTPGRYRMNLYQFNRNEQWPTNGPELLNLKGRAV